MGISIAREALEKCICELFESPPGVSEKHCWFAYIALACSKSWPFSMYLLVFFDSKQQKRTFVSLIKKGFIGRMLGS